MDAAIELLELGWLGTLFGLIGVILAIISIILFLKSRSAPEPVFLKHATRLLGRSENNLPDRVSVLFDGHEVERLTKTTLIFWNKGNDVLDSKNIVETDPIRFQFDNQDTILSAKFLKRTKDVNKAEFVQQENLSNVIQVSFDYLDPGDGFVLEILHNGENLFPIVRGSIKGVPTGIKDKGEFIFRPKKSLVFEKYVFVIGFIVILISVFLTYFNDSISVYFKGLHIISFMGFAVGSLFSTTMGHTLYFMRRRYPKNLEVN